MKPLNSGHVQVLNNCPLLVGNFKKIDTFGTQLFLACPLSVVSANWKFLCISKTDAISEKLKHLVKNYSEIFWSALGTIKSVRAKVIIEANSQLQFMKARSVPLEMKEAVEAEIDRMEEDVISKSVPYFEWAIPIVIVTKLDGTIKICADYKRTVNSVKNDKYPQPTPEELFSKT